jgi:hypothetical protein
MGLLRFARNDDYDWLRRDCFASLAMTTNRRDCFARNDDG